MFPAHKHTSAMNIFFLNVERDGSSLYLWYLCTWENLRELNV